MVEIGTAHTEKRLEAEENWERARVILVGRIGGAAFAPPDGN